MLVLTALALASCGGPVAGLIGAAEAPLVTPNPQATATATPFIPLLPTETPLPTATATAAPPASPTPANPWGDFAGPVEPSAIEIPAPMQAVRLPDGVVNIALLGIDQRPNEGGFRTDSLMILSLDPQDGTATLISIPRDLYVYIPGWRIDRINTADPRGGFDMLRSTLLYNFGLTMDHWVLVNFWNFTSIVDSLGGLDVQVTGYLADECGRRFWRYAPGTYHMDGFTALCYVRMREASSDFDRMRRQQEVVLALFDKILSLDGLSHIPDLYSRFNSSVQGDLTLGDILPLVPLGGQLAADRSRLRQYSIDATMVTAWRVPYSGAAVLLPKWDAIHQMLLTAFPQ
jgi:LCP family protein required for cell wall assembly